MISGLKKLKNFSAAKRNKLDNSVVSESKEPEIVNAAPSNIKTESIKFRTDREGFVQLALHVKPGSKTSRVAEITEKYIGLQISAPPRDGEANEEVISYIAEIFKLKERQVTLVSGSKSRDKLIIFDNNSKNLSIEQIIQILINNQKI